MKNLLLCAAGAIVLLAGSGPLTPGAAKGCIKGAAVGGVGGHMAGHHAVVGAAAGCAVGHHMANKKAKDAQANPPS